MAYYDVAISDTLWFLLGGFANVSLWGGELSAEYMGARLRKFRPLRPLYTPPSCEFSWGLFRSGGFLNIFFIISTPHFSTSSWRQAPPSPAPTAIPSLLRPPGDSLGDGEKGTLRPGRHHAVIRLHVSWAGPRAKLVAYGSWGCLHMHIIPLHAAVEGGNQQPLCTMIGLDRGGTGMWPKHPTGGRTMYT